MFILCHCVWGPCLVFVFDLTRVNSLEFATLSLSRDSELLNSVSSLTIMGTPKVRGNAFYIMGWP